MVNFTHSNAGKKASKNADVTVDEHMHKIYPTFDEKQDIFDAMDILLKYKISGAPVVDNQKAPIGFLSAKDCLRLVMDAKYYNMPPGKIQDYMSKHVMAVESGTNLYDVVELFIQHQYHCYPVVKKRDWSASSNEVPF